MRLLTAFFVLVFNCSLAYGQEATIKGTLHIAGSRYSDLQGTELQVFVPAIRLLVTTDEQGRFELNGLPYGTYALIFRNTWQAIDSIKIVANTSEVLLDTIELHLPYPIPEDNRANNTTAATVSEEELREDDEGNQHINPSLNASTRDPFTGTANFVLGAYNFRPRGQQSQQILINGISMNDLATRNAGWSQWGGLNDVLRNSNGTYGLRPAAHSFGAIQGSRLYDISAATQGKQSKLTYAMSNKSYRQRIMLTHSSGISPQGWAYTLSASRRWATEGYVPGMSMDAWDYYAGLSKYIGSRSLFHVMLLGDYSKRAKASAATDELFALSGNHYYNANWGFQNGHIRNARTMQQHVPMLVLSYEYQPSEQTSWQTSVAIQTGAVRNAALDWYKGSDPRADYYRNMPSYFAPSDPSTAAHLTEALHADPGKLQLNWDRLYSVNYSNYEWLHNANGIAGNDLYGRRSVYVIGSDVEQIRKATFSTILHRQLKGRISFHAGLSLKLQHSRFYRELTDLLGGDYFLNNNMFAEQQYATDHNAAQNDLNTPDRAIHKGNKYKYDYSYSLMQASAWSQVQIDLRKLNVFVAAQAALNDYGRSGHYRNGLYPDNSYGASSLLLPFTYAVKGGLNYKINGRNFLLLHGYMSYDDPGINNRFIAPRMRNQQLDNVSLQLTQSMEAGYQMKAPRLHLSAIAYAANQYGGTDIQRFYNDDPAFQTFVNYAMQDVSICRIGTELATAYQVTPSLTLNAMAALGQAFYSDNPKVRIYADNDTTTQPASRQVYLKNYYLGVGPQSAYSMGAYYSGRGHWYARINGSYLARNYVAVNPDRRTYEAAGLLPSGSQAYDAIYHQEMLAAFFVTDCSIGKSLRLRKISKSIAYNWMLNFSLNIANVLNNRNIKTGGYEQLRFDYQNNNPDKFPNKYFYGYGRTFLFSLSLKY